MSEHLQYYTTILGKKFGVHVDGLTKAEAQEMLINAADIQRQRDGGKMSAFDFAQFVDEVECPRDLNPSSASERWATRIVVFGIAIGVATLIFHSEIIQIMLIRLTHTNAEVY